MTDSTLMFYFAIGIGLVLVLCSCIADAVGGKLADGHANFFGRMMANWLQHLLEFAITATLINYGLKVAYTLFFNSH